MPETAIGHVPDCGVAHAFARMTAGLGLYLGLTGDTVGPADALALGLATHCIGRAEFDAIAVQLADAEPVDAVLDARHRDPGAGPLMTQAGRIARYFDAPGLKDILARLEAPEPDDREWAAATLATLRQRSPLALHLTFRAIRAAAALDIPETLMLDYRLAHRLLAGPELKEGVRAMLVDKDRAPRWAHARAEEVPSTLVDDYFAPLGADELALPTRDEMQAGRG
jgi:enoyl-CoA hydratase